MRAIYNVRVPRVRNALVNLAKYVKHKHPLIEQAFETDRRDLFIEHLGNKVNLYEDEQIRIRGIMELYLERVERDPRGLFKLYPCCYGAEAERAQDDSDQPSCGFWQAGDCGYRHLHCRGGFQVQMRRESIDDLASEYGVKPQQIEEAIRWEQRTAAVAA